MDKDEQIKLLNAVVRKCDVLINNDGYEADEITQSVVEDIAEMCNRALDLLTKGYID